MEAGAGHPALGDVGGARAAGDGEPAAANTEPDPDSCNLEWPLRPATVTSPALPTTVPPRAASNLHTTASGLTSVSVVTKKSLHQIVRI